VKRGSAAEVASASFFLFLHICHVLLRVSLSGNGFSACLRLWQSSRLLLGISGGTGPLRGVHGLCAVCGTAERKPSFIVALIVAVNCDG